MAKYLATLINNKSLTIECDCETVWDLLNLIEKDKYIGCQSHLVKNDYIVSLHRMNNVKVPSDVPNIKIHQNN